MRLYSSLYVEHQVEVLYNMDSQWIQAEIIIRQNDYSNEIKKSERIRNHAGKKFEICGYIPLVVKQKNEEDKHVEFGKTFEKLRR